ncbi:MAG: DegV family protein [Anaerostipes sp.]|nr:DegV family protein [Anaerostipes sp.]
MSFNIVCDSCTDLTKEDFEKGCYSWVPLTLLVEEYEIIDDETFNQLDFLDKVARSKGEVKSACPAPESYKMNYDKADDIYVITLSAELSGSYNSAVLAKNLYEEENGKKNIYVFNSRGASTTQILIARKIYEYASTGMGFEEVVEKVEEYISGQRTYFVLETLDVLKRNGRLSKVSATLASALNIKPVMEGTREGTIEKLGQARGTKKALSKLVDAIAEDYAARDLSDRILAVAHCNCKQRAEAFKDMLEKKIKAKEIIIIDTKGVSSLYACDGGIIVSY